jgi:histidinol-phosphatase (PHP family)
LLVDYHIHTPYCGHAHGKIIDYIETAIAAGIQEIGFSDHLGRYYLSKSQRRRYWDWGMSERALARYYLELSDCKDIYQDKITIRIGLEIDYIEGAEHLIEPIVNRYPFDFFLGSIHCIPRFGWKHLVHYSHIELKELYSEYFRLCKGAIESGLFSSLAHIDFIWRYISWPEKLSGQILDSIESIVALAAGKNACMEINSNGYMWSKLHRIEEGDPFIALVDYISRYKTPVSIGSDAHSPESVGKEIPRIIQMLYKKGIRTVRGFEELQPIEIPIKTKKRK